MMQQAATLSSSPVAQLQAEIKVPGDKSISHRALFMAAIANGDSNIHGFLQAEDCLATMHSLRALGVDIQQQKQSVHVRGVGLHGLQAADGALDCGNSGTSMRLISGLLCGQDFPSTVVGDRSLSARPMMRIVTPLRQMGAHIDTATGGTPPLHIKPSTGLQAIDYQLPISSAQLKSCLLLAALYARGQTSLSGAIFSRDHSERMLKHFACPVKQQDNRLCLSGGSSLCGVDVEVPGDFSSAAFFLVAACIVPGSEVLIRRVGVNPSRTAALDILRAMGADLELFNVSQLGQEPVADIRVRSSNLHGIRIPETLVDNAIDEFPILFIAAACAEGETELSGAAELRVKESDRIATMARGLKQCGIETKSKPDGLHIVGGRLQGGEVDSGDDHRVVMAFAVAGAAASDTITVRRCASLATSFPEFSDVAQTAGLALQLN